MNPTDTTQNKKTTVLLTRSQEAALTQLLALARLNFSNPSYGPVKLRTIPLILGPSGVGKTHLVRELAERLKLRVLKLSYGEWIIEAARHEPSTFRRIRQELDRGQSILLHIDELDKFVFTTDPWSRALFGEVFGLLDRAPGATSHHAVEVGKGRLPGWTDEQVQQLASNVFIVTSGTWMSLFEARVRRPIGFWQGQESKGGIDLAALRSAVRNQGIIPAELLNRLNEDWLVLEPYSENDFRALAKSMELSPDLFDPEEAVASGLNFRFLENRLTRSAVAAMQERETLAAETLQQE